MAISTLLYRIKNICHDTRNQKYNKKQIYLQGWLLLFQFKITGDLPFFLLLSCRDSYADTLSRGSVLSFKGNVFDENVSKKILLPTKNANSNQLSSRFFLP